MVDVVILYVVVGWLALFRTWAVGGGRGAGVVEK